MFEINLVVSKTCVPLHQQNKETMNFTVATKKGTTSVVTITPGNFDAVSVTRDGVSWTISMRTFTRRIESGFWVEVK